MPHRYVATFSASSSATLRYLTAGSQGLTLRAVVLFTTAAASTTTMASLERASAVTGGSSGVIAPLDDPAPVALAAFESSPTSTAPGGTLGNFTFVGPNSGRDLLAESGPVDVAPGDSIRFQVGVGSASLNVYFEE